MFARIFYKSTQIYGMHINVDSYLGAQGVFSGWPTAGRSVLSCDVPPVTRRHTAREEAQFKEEEEIMNNTVNFASWATTHDLPRYSVDGRRLT